VNALHQTGNGDPQGRKGSCIVPRDLISEMAKAPGSTTMTGIPGQVVLSECTPVSG
jgi:hypothetical protein